MRYMIDIDGTICESQQYNPETDEYPDYTQSVPYKDRIKQLNDLYDAGHEIYYWTARGTNSGIDWLQYTIAQLESWGVKYHSIQTGKPHYDIWVDDKAREIGNFFND